MRGLRKPLLCRLGVHQLFADTVGTNVGTEETPVWVFNTCQTCNRCEWTTRPERGGAA